MSGLAEAVEQITGDLLDRGALVGGDDLPAGFLLEDGEGGGRDFFGEYDLHVLEPQSSGAGRVPVLPGGGEVLKSTNGMT